jgi:hypothetical protein
MPITAPSALPGVAQDGEDDEEAEGHEAHVRDRRVGDQLLHVLLHQRDEADVDHRDQRQRDDQPVQLGAGIRRDRQAEAQEAVAADLQHDRRQDHRAAGGRLHVRVRQPGVHRKHRHLDRKREQEGDEDQDLRRHAELQPWKSRMLKLSAWKYM